MSGNQFSTGFSLITPNEKDDSDYIYQSLYGEIVQRQLRGLVTGSNYPAVNSSDVKNLELIIPSSTEERQFIGCFFRTIDKEINITMKLKEKLIEQKNGLMQRLLTGEVRVAI